MEIYGDGSICGRPMNGFIKETKDGTNLRIIQNYLDSGIEVDLIGIERWTNCNTKEDYNKIVSYWNWKEV